MSTTWEVYALKYASRNDRVRAESFVFDDRHEVAHPMDYYIWVLKSDERIIVVDSGFDAVEARRRSRPILRAPAAALSQMGISAETVDTLIVTHMHYDHIGGVSAFPNATLHLQSAEMAYATGPCMCHEAFREPYTVDHVCDVVRRNFAGRVVFCEGDSVVADGVTVHRIGGHTRGLQAVRVLTAQGWLCLASDAAHFYENYLSDKPFPLVVDVEDMLEGFCRIQELATLPSLVIPGHDPLVGEHFPKLGQCDGIVRLDQGPELSLSSLVPRFFLQGLPD